MKEQIHDHICTLRDQGASALQVTRLLNLTDKQIPVMAYMRDGSLYFTLDNSKSESVIHSDMTMKISYS